MTMRLTPVLALALAFTAASALAADHHGAASDSLRHVSSASERSGSVTALGVMDTSNVATAESLSGMFSMGSDWLQALASVTQTKGSFSFAVGAIYKFTVAGTRANGFHMGPGFTVGTVADDFAFAVFGACGGHFTLADRLLFSVDAGPMVTHTANNTNFRLRGLGNLLGASVHYVF
jgi:hypothetical protein